MPIQHVGLIIQLTYKGNETTSEHEIEAPTPEAAAEFLRRTMAKALAEELMRGIRLKRSPCISSTGMMRAKPKPSIEATSSASSSSPLARTLRA
jgi:hypothetical protein